MHYKACDDKKVQMIHETLINDLTMRKPNQIQVTNDDMWKNLLQIWFDDLEVVVRDGDEQTLQFPCTHWKNLRRL